VEQIERTGATWVTTTCENCKTPLEDLNVAYELGVEIKGVVDLIADALILLGSLSPLRGALASQSLLVRAQVGAVF
jgi:hypothetical protein